MLFILSTLPIILLQQINKAALGARRELSAQADSLRPTDRLGEEYERER